MSDYIRLVFLKLIVIMSKLVCELLSIFCVSSCVHHQLILSLLTFQLICSYFGPWCEGIEMRSLCVGEPNFPPPQAVIDAAVEDL